jgi:hypothetical protein
MQGSEGYFERIKEGIDGIADEQIYDIFCLGGVVSVPNNKCHNNHDQKRGK